MRIILLCFASIFVCTNTYAGNQINKQIKISADTLVSDVKADYAEFRGNVTAFQGNTILTCDCLTIKFIKNKNSTPKTQNKSLAGSDSIREIIAEGNVYIQFDDKLAQSDLAVYDMIKNIMILTGPNTQIISGRDSIRGSKIILDRSTGLTKVESNTKKPIEVNFYPGKKILE